jgi:hypothetical protein
MRFCGSMTQPEIGDQPRLHQMVHVSRLLARWARLPPRAGLPDPLGRAPKRDDRD